MSVHHTKAFQSGNSAAVRLPKELGITAGTRVTIAREGRDIVLRPAAEETREELRARMIALITRLDEIGRTGEAEVRDPDIFPDRPGLY